jgi:hypothetical protein
MLLCCIHGKSSCGCFLGVSDGRKLKIRGGVDSGSVVSMSCFSKLCQWFESVKGDMHSDEHMGMMIL